MRLYKRAVQILVLRFGSHSQKKIKKRLTVKKQAIVSKLSGIGSVCRLTYSPIPLPALSLAFPILASESEQLSLKHLKSNHV